MFNSLTDTLAEAICNALCVTLGDVEALPLLDNLDNTAA